MLGHELDVISYFQTLRKTIEKQPHHPFSSIDFQPTGCAYGVARKQTTGFIITEHNICEIGAFLSRHHYFRTLKHNALNLERTDKSFDHLDSHECNADFRSSVKK